MDASKLRELTDWLIDGGRSAVSPSRFMAECCERMVEAGLPLWRIGVFVVVELERREKVELEADSRVHRRHHAVGDELDRPGAAEMAIEAHSGAGARALERDHAVCVVGGVVCVD